MPPLTAKKISDLVEIVGAAGMDDEIPVVHSGVTEKIKVKDLIYYDPFNPLRYGAIGNGVIDDYAALNTLFNTTLVGVVTGIYLTRIHRIGTSLTISTNLSLYFFPGGGFSIDPGCVLTIQGPVSAPLRRIFWGTGTVVFTAGYGQTIEVYPEWWGADTPGVTDHAAYVNAAIASLPSAPDNYETEPTGPYGGTVRLSQRTWGVNLTPIALKNMVHLIGSGEGTIIKGITAAKNVNLITAIPLGALPIYDVEVAHLSMWGQAFQGDADYYVAGQSGVYGEKVYMSKFHHLWGVGLHDSGIKIKGASYTHISDNTFRYCGGHGIWIWDPNNNYWSVPSGDASYYVTALWVKDNTICRNGKSGIKGIGWSRCFIRDNTLESNGNDSAANWEDIGIEGEGEGILRPIQIHLAQTTFTKLQNNTVETGHIVNTEVAVALTGGWLNVIEGNGILTYKTVGPVRGLALYIWSPYHSAPLAGAVRSYQTQISKNFFSYNEPAVVVGVHDGANNQPILTDSTATWTPGQWIGYTVQNTTDGSQGVVTANDATHITATLAGGAENDWDTGDAYAIPGFMNIVTAKAAFATAPGSIYLEDNYGARIGDAAVSKSQINALGRGRLDGMERSWAVIPYETPWVPKPLATARADRLMLPLALASYEYSGDPPNMAYQMTLTAAVTINVPDATYVRDGQHLLFLLIQDGTGGWGVTWGAGYVTDYSDVGNVATKKATVEFVWRSGVSCWVQVGKMGWS